MVANAIYSLLTWTKPSLVSLMDQCHSCAALKTSPTARIDRSKAPSPDAISRSFAADVTKRSRQFIFVLRETVTFYTSTISLLVKRHQTLREAIVKLCLEMRPIDGYDRYLVVAIDPPFCDIKKFIGPQLRSSSYHVKLSECFKVPSDLTTTSRVLHPCHEHDSDDEDDPYAPPHPPPSLPDIRDAISALAQPLSNTPRCVTPPAPVCPADHSLDDASAPPSCPEDPPCGESSHFSTPPLASHQSTEIIAHQTSSCAFRGL